MLRLRTFGKRVFPGGFFLAHVNNVCVGVCSLRSPQLPLPCTMHFIWKRLHTCCILASCLPLRLACLPSSWLRQQTSAGQVPKLEQKLPSNKTNWKANGLLLPGADMPCTHIPAAHACRKCNILRHRGRTLGNATTRHCSSWLARLVKLQDLLCIKSCMPNLELTCFHAKIALLCLPALSASACEPCMHEPKKRFQQLYGDNHRTHQLLALQGGLGPSGHQAQGPWPVTGEPRGPDTCIAGTGTCIGGTRDP